MVRFLGHLFLLASLTFLVGYYKLTWWGFAPLALLTGLVFSGNSYSKFMVGILAVGGVWAAYSYYVYTYELGKLVPKIAQLFGLYTDSNSLILVLVTASIGAMIGGLSVLTGHSLRQIFYKPKRDDIILRRN